MNITIPAPLYARLLKKTNKSGFIAQAVREKLEAEEKSRRQEALAAAYRRTSKEEAELAREWDATAGDGL